MVEQLPPTKTLIAYDGNREQWLTEMAKEVEPIFRGYTLAPYRVTCGWPCRGGLGKCKRVVGECHSLASSKSGTHEIFISPMLDQPLDVAGTLCHELAHVAAGIEAAHGYGFVSVCKHVGLTQGKPTNVMPGEKLNELLQRHIEKLGSYPHSALIPQIKKKLNPRNVSKINCAACGCVATMSFKWIDTAGLPTCGCGQKMIQLDIEDE